MKGQAVPCAIREIAVGVHQVTFQSVISMHVYLIDSPEGVVAVDAAISGVGAEIREAAGGPLAKVVLTHSHIDHRGAATEVEAPILCQPDEVADAQGDGGSHYIEWGLVSSDVVREQLPRLHAAWDGGPVEISGTLAEGDRIGDFRVIHLPGHAPGLIALYRDLDGMALASDVVYTIDPETGQDGPARVPHPAFNWNTEHARDSVRKLRDLGPTSVWPGHGEQLGGDVSTQLDAAADWSYSP